MIQLQDPGKVYTIAEYKNRQHRYTMSEYVVEIERLTIHLEKAMWIKLRKLKQR